MFLRRSLLLTLTLLATLAPKLHASDCHLRLLAQFAFHAPEHRTAEMRAYWFRYKNTRGAVPRRWDFSNPDPNQPAIEIADWPGIIGTPQYKPFTPTQHETDLLLVRAGDIVVYDDQKFTIQEFLGAGNATHIYAYEESSGLILGIPFLTGWWGQMVQVAASYQSHLLNMRHAMKISTEWLYSRNRETRVAVFPDPSGLHRYRLTSRVNGTENGWGYIQKLFPDADAYAPVSSLSLENIPASEHGKLNRLIRAMRSNSHSSLETASNYMWDKDRGWILIDGDDEV